MSRGGKLDSRFEPVIIKALALRAQGAIWSEIGKQLGVNYELIRGAMYRRGYEMNGKRGRRPLAVVEPERVQLAGQARVLRALGVRWKVIERQLGVPWKSLAHHIYRENKAAQQQC